MKRGATNFIVNAGDSRLLQRSCMRIVADTGLGLK